MLKVRKKDIVITLIGFCFFELFYFLWGTFVYKHYFLAFPGTHFKFIRGMESISNCVFDVFDIQHLEYGPINLLIFLLIMIIPFIRKKMPLWAPLLWQIFAAFMWEIIENTNWLIHKYRGVPQGDNKVMYYGDPVLNSLADTFVGLIGILIVIVLFKFIYSKINSRFNYLIGIIAVLIYFILLEFIGYKVFGINLTITLCYLIDPNILGL